MVSLHSPSVVADVTASLLVFSIAESFIGGKVLDVGCKNKPYKRYFDDCEWVGLDKRPVGDIIGDAHFMNGIEDNSFDTVLCINMLHVCESPVMVTKQIARVLKPGGHAIIAVPNTCMDDHKTLWGITGRGLEYLIAAAQLEITQLVADGKMFTSEWKEHFGGVNTEIAEWTSKMDQRYPTVSFAIARKPEG